MNVVLLSPEEGISYFEDGVTHSCKLPNEVTRNQTWIL